MGDYVKFRFNLVDETMFYDPDSLVEEEFVEAVCPSVEIDRENNDNCVIVALSNEEPIEAARELINESGYNPVDWALYNKINGNRQQHQR